MRVSQPRRPNILFVMTDDQTVREMSCYGETALQTPNMDRIASGGTRFANCFTTNSLCAPARATVLTGAFSHIHGITGNSEQIDAVEELDPHELRNLYGNPEYADVQAELTKKLQELRHHYKDLP